MVTMTDTTLAAVIWLVGMAMVGGLAWLGICLLLRR